MSTSTAVDQILFATNFGELKKQSHIVEAGGALAAVYPDAFDPMTCPQISYDERKALRSGNMSLKSKNGRNTNEYRGRSWLPIMNASDEPRGEKHILLPLEVAELAVYLHGTRSEEFDENKRLDFGIDEFRSSNSGGDMHSDGWLPDDGLNIHVTACGEGVLHIARLNADGLDKIDREGKVRFFEPNGEHLRLISGEFHTAKVGPGTIAIFSAFGSRLDRREPLLHKVTTTSPLRSSLSLDQAQVIHKRPPKKLAEIIQLFGENGAADYETMFVRAA